MSILERFHASIMPEPNTGCWLWTRPLRLGYGLFSIKSKTLSAHRFSFEYYKSNIPKGFNVCHTCDTPSCVNPDHLFLGTHQQNMNDRDRKGRVSRGSKHYTTYFTEIEIRVIRDACCAGFSNASVGRYFKVSRNAIWRIKNKCTWKHI